MTIGSLLVGLALLVLVIPVVAAPLREPGAGRRARRRAGAGSDPDLPAVLVSLRDLDFDYHTGKISEADHADLRRSLMTRAAQALEMPTSKAAPGDPQCAERGRPAEAGQSRALAHCDVCSGRLAPGDRFCSTCGHPAPSLCPQCGRRQSRSDRFCSACGASLAIER